MARWNWRRPGKPKFQLQVCCGVSWVAPPLLHIFGWPSRFFLRLLAHAVQACWPHLRQSLDDWPSTVGCAYPSRLDARSPYTTYVIFPSLNALSVASVLLTRLFLRLIGYTLCPVALRQLSRLLLESMLSHDYPFIVRTKTTCALHAQREHGDCYCKTLFFCPFGKVVPVGGWYPTSYFPWFFAGRDAVISKLATDSPPGFARRTCAGFLKITRVCPTVCGGMYLHRCDHYNDMKQRYITPPPLATDDCCCKTKLSDAGFVR